MARARVGDKEVIQPLLIPPVSSEDGAGYLELPRRTIRVAFVERPLVSLSVEEPATGFVIDRRRNLEVQLPCKIERCAQCLAPHVPLNLDIEGLPPGMRLANQQLSATGESAALTLVADPKVIEPGLYRIVVRAHGQEKGREFSETTPAIGVWVK